MLRVSTFCCATLAILFLLVPSASSESLEQMVEEDEAATMKEAGVAADPVEGGAEEQAAPAPVPEAPRLNPNDVRPDAREFPEVVAPGGNPDQVPEESGEVDDPDEITIDEGEDPDALTVHEGAPAPIEVPTGSAHPPIERGEVDDPDEITVSDGTDVDDVTAHEEGLRPIAIDPTVEDAPEEGVGGDYGD